MPLYLYDIVKFGLQTTLYQKSTQQVIIAMLLSDDRVHLRRDVGGDDHSKIAHFGAAPVAGHGFS